MSDRRRGARRRTSEVLVLLIGSLLVSMSTASASLPVTSTPRLDLSRTIKTSPFVGSTTTIKDNEDIAYVPVDNSIWLVDDNADSAYEVDAVTGALKRRLTRADFEAAPSLGGGPLAGPNRPGDLEALAYDAANDILYAFSGSCCSSSALPTAFRLMRDGSHRLSIESYQPLATGSDFTAASWNSVITREDHSMEVKNPVRGIAHDTDVAKITIVGVPDRPGIAYQIFHTLADSNINVDIIVQNVSLQGIADLSFTVNLSELAKADKVLAEIVKNIGAREIRNSVALLVAQKDVFSFTRIPSRHSDARNHH
jgi:predicted amino acid-binding ACT domain protein